ncbi:MAG: serine hydrolase domain-containing protein [Thermoleophilia bacterium]
MNVDGFAEPGYEAVAEAFARNFTEHGEIGASVAVHHRGRLVVDLAGGTDPVRGRPFTRDSLMMVASCSKGAVATAVLMLADAGLLDPDDPVAAHWPEFAGGDKERVTVRQVLSHQAGLPYPDPEAGLTGFDQLTGPALLDRLARQAPWWEPGEAFAYHPTTGGTILGEVVRRVTGTPFGAWFAGNVAGPLGLEFWFGLPEDLDDRVALSVWEPSQDAGDEPPPAEGSYAARRLAAIATLPPMDPDPHDPASVRAYHGAEVPAGGGITNARSLSRMYAALIGEVDGVRLLSEETLAAAREPQTDGVPALIERGTAGPDIRFGLGYQLPSGSMPGLGPSSFGHTGAGGRLGLADPETGIAFGYVCNSMRGIGAGGDPRWATLLGAIRDCV